MSEKMRKYDMKSPEAKALIDEIVHGTFMKEGTMAAFPTCFPGASIPIPADESHITALDVSGDGMIYGGTSGRAAHLFVGIFHGVTGIVFDLGLPVGADHCAAVCCAKSKVVSCVNGPGGGRIVATSQQGLPYDLIQEWGFTGPPLMTGARWTANASSTPLPTAPGCRWSAPPGAVCSRWTSNAGNPR